jgi:enoyl-CoA hydratase/carnithine racemase
VSAPAAALDPASAGRLLGAAARGEVELEGTLGGEPLLVVDLDAGRSPPDAGLPPWLPAVVIGLSGASPPPAAPPWVDLALTASASAPPPWVKVADAAAATAEIAERVRSNPLASLVLCQVLRSGSAQAGPQALEADLLRESLAYSALQAGPEHARWLSGRPRRQAKEPGGGPIASPVLAEHDGRRLILSLNRPQVHNAYSASMRDALCLELAQAAAGGVFDRIELRGSGESFCSGGDLEEFGTRPDPATAHVVRTSRSAGRLLYLLRERVTAYLHGACAGAGIELAAFCGRVVASDSARMWLPEVAMGLIPGAGGTASLPRRIGRQRTAWMGLSGTPISAGLAKEWGLVDEISSDQQPSSSSGSRGGA